MLGSHALQFIAMLVLLLLLLLSMPLLCYATAVTVASARLRDDICGLFVPAPLAGG